MEILNTNFKTQLSSRIVSLRFWSDHKLCYENPAVSNILHLRSKKTYTKFVSLYSSQAGRPALPARKGPYGSVSILYVLGIHVLYTYSRLSIHVRVLCVYYRATSFKVYFFWVKMHYIMNCRGIMSCQNQSCTCMIIHLRKV